MMSCLSLQFIFFLVNMTLLCGRVHIISTNRFTLLNGFHADCAEVVGNILEVICVVNTVLFTSV